MRKVQFCNKFSYVTLEKQKQQQKKPIVDQEIMNKKIRSVKVEIENSYQQSFPRFRKKIQRKYEKSSKSTSCNEKMQKKAEWRKKLKLHFQALLTKRSLMTFQHCLHNNKSVSSWSPIFNSTKYNHLITESYLLNHMFAECIEVLRSLYMYCNLKHQNDWNRFSV